MRLERLLGYHHVPLVVMAPLQIALIGDFTTPTESLDGQLGGLGICSRVQGAWVDLEGLEGA